MENQQQIPPIPPSQPIQPVQSRILTLPGVGDLLKRSWQIYKSRFWIFLGIMFIPLLISLVIRIFAAVFAISIAGLLLGFRDLNLWIIVPFFFVVLLVILFLLFIFTIWPQVSLLYAIKEREQKIGIKESFAKGRHKIISYWWLSILSALIVMGGLILFIVPGIIFAIWFSLALYILVAEDLKGMNAFFRSKQLVSGKWWSVLWRILIITLIVVVISVGIQFLGDLFNKNLGGILSSIISVLFTPLLVIYSFLIYEDLKKFKGEIPFEAPKRGTKIKYILIGIVGLLLIPAILGGIVMTSLSGTREKARDAKRMADLSSIHFAAEMYYDANNIYPSTLNDLKSYLYGAEIPTDPKTNLPYQYILSENGKDFQLCADFEKQEDECLNSKGETVPKNEIKTGKIEIDYEKFRQTKGKLPEGGHQPWLADPKLVAQAEGLSYGFNYEDFETAKEIVFDAENGIAKYEVSHKDKVYILTVIQPIVGENKVWALSEIQEEKTEGQTANWQTYKNEQYGFEIKYPEKYIISPFAFGKPPQVILNDSNKDFIEGCFYNEKGFPEEDIVKRKITINNITFCLSKTENAGAGSVFPTYYYTTPKNGKYITLKFEVTYQSCGAYYGLPKFQECEEFSKNLSENIEKPIENILSTFKFLNQDETADWKTYRNEDWGFGIKYPGNWKISESSNSFKAWEVFNNEYDCISTTLFYEEDYSYLLEEDQDYKKESVYIDNNPATKFFYPDFPEQACYSFSQIKGGKVFHFRIFFDVYIHGAHDPIRVKEHNCSTIFNQMLSTFTLY